MLVYGASALRLHCRGFGDTWSADHSAAGCADLEPAAFHANFVLVKVGDGNAIFKAMMDKGVIVRAMAAYKLPEWVRISVGTMPQNEKCIEVLKQVLGK